MGLRIRKLDTTCHVPRRYRKEAGVVERLARGRFAADLGAHLGHSLSRQAAVVRIKELRVRVIIPASELNEASLSRAWTEAFSRALFTTLAYPAGIGPFDVFRAESVVVFVAGAIRDLLNDTAVGNWRYAEFEEMFRSGVSAATTALLTGWPQLTLPILFELERFGVLEKMLARLDDLTLERLFVTLALPADSPPAPLTIADLIATAKLVLQGPPAKFSTLRGRRFALRLYVRARMGSEPICSPRAVFQMLTALGILLSNDLSLLRSVIQGQPAGSQLPQATTDLLRAVAREVHFAAPSPQLSQLGQVLSDLRIALKIPPPPATGARVRWISTEWCGLFFLTGTLVRLGWVAAWQKLPDFQAGGISPLMAGLALTITGEFGAPPRALEPGVALFSGYLGDPDISHLKKVFQDDPLEARRKVLLAALGSGDGCETWAGAFERLSNHLLGAFRSRIRGFQKSPPESITRMFLQRPGRIRIEEECLRIQPQASTYHVALHIAGLDEAIAAVPWLGERRLEFEIGDL